MRAALEGLALVVLCVGPLVLFAAFDQRPPDDHDPYYTGHLRSEVSLLADVPGDVLGRRLENEGGRHPPLADLALLGSLRCFGPTLFAYRVATLPFLLLLVLGTAGATAEVLGRRAGLLAGLLVASLPIVVQASRKTDLMFHAAGVGAVALWLAVRLITRKDAGWTVWLAFGVIQGVRCYSHPIVLGDLVLLQLGVATTCWRRPGGWVRWWLATTVTAAIALPFLGLGGATWSLAHYLEARAEFLVGGEGAASAGLVTGAVTMLREGVVHALRPPLALLVAVPAAIALGPALGRVGEPRSRRALILVVGVVLGQLPLVLITRSHGAFLTDWLGLAPALVLGAVLVATRVAAAWELGSRVRGGWVIAVVAGALAGAWGPTVVSMWGPDPLVDPGWYERAPFASLVDPSFGGARLQHQLVSRGPSAAAAVADAAGPGDGGPARVGSGWLQHGPGCAWEWRASPDPLVGSDWPFVFAGFSGLERVPLEAAPAVVVIGLGGAHVYDDGEAWQSRGPGVDRPCLEQARAVASTHLGVPLEAVAVHDDPARWFLGTGAQRRSRYLGALLVITP